MVYRFFTGGRQPDLGHYFDYEAYFSIPSSFHIWVILIKTTSIIFQAEGMVKYVSLWTGCYIKLCARHVSKIETSPVSIITLVPMKIGLRLVDNSGFPGVNHPSCWEYFEFWPPFFTNYASTFVNIEFVDKWKNLGVKCTFPVTP